MRLSRSLRVIFVFVFVFLGACRPEPTLLYCSSSITADSKAVDDQCEWAFSSDDGVLELSGLIKELGQSSNVVELKKLVDSLEGSPLQANALLESSGYFNREEDLEMTIDYLSKSADLFARDGDHSRQANAYHRLYLIDWRRSNYQGALAWASKARRASVSGNDLNAEIEALNAFFNVFEEVGSLGPAQQALSLISEKMSEGVSLRHSINASIAQGRLHVSRKEYALGEHNFQKALSLAKNSKNRSALRGLHLNIVSANTFLGQFKKAEKHLEIAWSYANEDGSAKYALLFYQALLEHKMGRHDSALLTMENALSQPDLPDVWAWEMHLWAGNAAHSLGRVDDALVQYKRSIASSKSLRMSMGLNQLKAHMMARKREAHEALFIELYDNEQYSDAFEIAEETKASAFLDSYVKSGELSTINSEQLPLDKTISERVDVLEEYLGLMNDSPISTDNDRDNFDLDNVLLTLSEVELLSYFIAQQRVFLFLVSDGVIKPIELETSRVELESLIFMVESDPNNHQYLSQLGRLLLPSDIALKGGHYYVSSDSLLNRISFLSLRAKDRYLGDENTITLVPGASALTHMILNRAQAPDATGVNLLGDADGSLPAANIELSLVGDIFNSEPLVNSQANVRSLFSNIRPEILHIATHSGVNHLGPWLAMADSRVSGVELIAKGIKPKIAVLASCASGSGQGKYLWGSLGGALLSNGADTVLVTLRSVEDSLTKQIVLDFYRYYVAGETAAESLRLAQNQAQKRGVSVSDWSAYTLLGLHDTVLSDKYTAVRGLDR